MNLVFFCISAAILVNQVTAASTSVPSLDVTDAPEKDFSGTDPPEKDDFNIEKISSNTGYIQISWNYTGGKDVDHFQIITLRIDNGVVIHSPIINEEEYTIEDLRTYTEYRICLIATFEDDSEEETCEEMSTLPLLSKDSILAIVILIIVILLLIIISYCLAAKKKRDYEADQLAEADEEAEKDENLKNGESNGPVPAGQPKSSIEEANEIPYITPPVLTLYRKA